MEDPCPRRDLNPWYTCLSHQRTRKGEYTVLVLSAVKWSPLSLQPYLARCTGLRSCPNNFRVKKSAIISDRKKNNLVGNVWKHLKGGQEKPNLCNDSRRHKIPPEIPFSQELSDKFALYCHVTVIDTNGLKRHLSQTNRKLVGSVTIDSDDGMLAH